MAGKVLRVLHTSDWHIGQKLFNNNRDEEFEAFFEWLAATIQERKVDVLLVAGDVFDVKSPANRAQEIYYKFLWSLRETCCRHVVITAGNHDSPDFIAAPSPLLKILNIHVVGAPSEKPEDEVLLLRDEAGIPELIVCAVPYLRERDVRKVEAGESVSEKDARLHEGIARHYRMVSDMAEGLCARFGGNLPVVGMGHLWAAGAKIDDGETERDFYIGNLGQVDSSIFSDTFDYIALGHLHGPQRVGGRAHIRYSGSPLAMSFDEAQRKKKVYLLEFEGKKPDISEIDVPVFRRLITIRGDWSAINAELESLARLGCDMRNGPWVEVVYEGEEVIPNLSAQVDGIVAGSGILIARKRDERRMREIMVDRGYPGGLDELSPRQVFEICLHKEIAESEWTEYLEAFDFVLRRMEEDEARGE